MTGSVVVGNRQLAARARDIAARAPRPSLDRSAALCLAVCLATTGSVNAATRALGDVEQPEIRQAAAQLLARLVNAAGRQSAAGAPASITGEAGQ